MVKNSHSSVQKLTLFRIFRGFSEPKSPPPTPRLCIFKHVWIYDASEFLKMLKAAALALPVPNPGIPCSFSGGSGAVSYSSWRMTLKLHNRPRFASSTVQSVGLSSAVGSSPELRPYQYTYTHRHIHVLSFIACGVAISATWLFCSAIPTLLAFRRAAESLEKLMDATREELPDTMAAVRLSGMEISDLTTELNDLGHEITQGIRNSTRAIRVAEERLRQLTDMTPTSGGPKRNRDT